MFKIILLGFCILLSAISCEKCVNYQNISNIVVIDASSDETIFSVYPWGQKIGLASTTIHHPNWKLTEIDDFMLPVRTTESNPLKTERLAIPLMQIVGNNLQKLKKFQNYIHLETLNRTTIHLFENVWSEYRPNYKLILHEKPDVMKCRTVYDCQPLQYCKILYFSENFQNTLTSNTIYLQWMEINQTVSIKLQIHNQLLFCQHDRDILKIDNVQIRTETLQKYRMGMYSFIKTTEPQSYQFESKFNLEQNRYVHLLIALCTLCKMEVKLMNNTTTFDESYLDGIDYKNQKEKGLRWQHIYLTAPRSCNDCFIKLTTISNEIHPFWIITNELQIGKTNDNDFISTDSVSRNLITHAKTIQNSLEKRFVNDYNKILICEFYGGKRRCIYPKKLGHFEISLYRDSPTIIKWCENSPNLPYEYHIQVFNPRTFLTTNLVIEKIKIVHYRAQFDNNCFIEPLLHLESRTIYEIQIFSSVSEGYLYFQTP